MCSELRKKALSGERQKDIFSQFPNDKKVSTAWFRAIRRDVGRHFKITEHTRVCSRHFNEADFQRTLAGRRKLCSPAVASIFSWKKDSPKKRKPPKSRRTGANLDNEELETHESNSFDNAFQVIEVETEVNDHIENDRTTKQEENILELKERMEKFEKKVKEFRKALEVEKNKTKAVDIKLRDAQVVSSDRSDHPLPRVREKNFLF